MTVYVLMIFPGNYIEGIYADQSEAEAAGERLTGRRRLYTHYTVEQETVIGG